MVIQNYATISERFKSFIKGGEYECVILELLNASTQLFPNQYEHLESQSNGECDFIDKKTGAKYDAKLPITKEQGKWIGSRDSDFEKWLKSMMNECAEFSEKIIKERGFHKVEELKLYDIMKKEIENDKSDENIIFFFPFPIVFDYPEGVYRQFASDILSNIYDALKENGIIGDQKIYAIYPGADRTIAIRLLNTGVREWFPAEILDEYIRYDAFLVKGEN